MGRPGIRQGQRTLANKPDRRSDTEFTLASGRHLTRRLPMAWTASDIPDLTGKVAVVTGANGGLGLETAAALAAKGALVVMAARNMEKAGTARLRLVDSNPDAAVEVVHLDLASLESVAEFAAAALAAHPRIDILVNNAGIMGTPRLETADGFELQFGTNHLGHFALAHSIELHHCDGLGLLLVA